MKKYKSKNPSPAQKWARKRFSFIGQVKMITGLSKHMLGQVHRILPKDSQYEVKYLINNIIDSCDRIMLYLQEVNSYKKYTS